MPELPEVEMFRRYLNRHAQGKTIQGVMVEDPGDFRGLTPEEIGKRLSGARLEPAGRRGKYLVVPVTTQAPAAARRRKQRQSASRRSPEGFLIIHFGMTGDLHFSRSGAQTPRYARVGFQFQSGTLHYLNMRRFGGVWWTTEPDQFKRLAILGLDALEVTSALAFRKALARTRQPLKQALLNQRLICGVGNLYADEILFQCGVSPLRRPQSLKTADWVRMFRSVRSVLRTALRRNADIDTYPKSYLLRHRERGGSCPRCRARLSVITQGGRTTIYCARCQK
jgi:formamidopyrimidine-DNA glycosylase